MSAAKCGTAHPDVAPLIRASGYAVWRACSVVLSDRLPVSPVPVLRKNVISCLHYGVAQVPALGVVRLRRLVSQGAEPERIGCGVILEHSIPPSAAVREPPAVLYHEVHVMLGARHGRAREG